MRSSMPPGRPVDEPVQRARNANLPAVRRYLRSLRGRVRQTPGTALPGLCSGLPPLRPRVPEYGHHQRVREECTRPDASKTLRKYRQMQGAFVIGVVSKDEAQPETSFAFCRRQACRSKRNPTFLEREYVSTYEQSAIVTRSCVWQSTGPAPVPVSWPNKCTLFP